ncbi:hypothetical protein [Paenibacillus sp. sgz500958]
MSASFTLTLLLRVMDPNFSSVNVAVDAATDLTGDAPVEGNDLLE